MTSCTGAPRGVSGEDTCCHSNIVSDLFECLSVQNVSGPETEAAEWNSAISRFTF